MIAPDFALLVLPLVRLARAPRLATGAITPFIAIGRAMTFPWFPLCLNFALLGVALFVCKTINASRGAPVWNGALIFVGFCVLAIVADLLLTLVFASAPASDRMRYVNLSSTSAWSMRTVAYVIPCVVGIVLAVRFRQRKRAAPPSVRISTSDYTHSEMSL